MANAIRLDEKSVLYERDFFAWARQQAAALRSHDRETLDFDNLAEEVEDLARKERRELRSRLMRILAHLLKFRFQPGRRSRSWEATLQTQRDAISGVLADSPNLRRELPEIIAQA